MIRNSSDSRKTYQYLCLGAKSQSVILILLAVKWYLPVPRSPQKPSTGVSVTNPHLFPKSLTTVCGKRKGETHLSVLRSFCPGLDAQTRAKRWTLWWRESLSFSTSLQKTFSYLCFVHLAIGTTSLVELRFTDVPLFFRTPLKAQRRCLRTSGMDSSLPVTWKCFRCAPFWPSWPFCWPLRFF